MNPALGISAEHPPLKLECAPASPGGLVKMQVLVQQVWGWEPRCCQTFVIRSLRAAAKPRRSLETRAGPLGAACPRAEVEASPCWSPESRGDCPRVGNCPGRAAEGEGGRSQGARGLGQWEAWAEAPPGLGTALCGPCPACDLSDHRPSLARGTPLTSGRGHQADVPSLASCSPVLPGAQEQALGNMICDSSSKSGPVPRDQPRGPHLDGDKVRAIPGSGI